MPCDEDTVLSSLGHGATEETAPAPVPNDCSADVAKLLGKNTTAGGAIRDRLLKRALCYSPRWGELGFTAPMFDQFMKRWMPWSPPN